MGEVKLSNRIRQNSEAAPWVVDAVKLLEAERDALKARLAALADAGTGYSQQTVDAITRERDALLAEVAKLTDKALRYDLDQLGISQREREAVELVDLRAEVAKLRAACAAKDAALLAFDADQVPHDMALEMREAVLSNDAGKGWVDSSGAVEATAHCAEWGADVEVYATVPDSWAGATVKIVKVRK